MFLSVLTLHILGFEFASCLHQCTRKYCEESYEEFDYNHLDIYHYANLKFYPGRDLSIVCVKFYQKFLEIQKAFEINLRVRHCLQSGFLHYTYYDFDEKPILLLLQL